MKFRKKPVVIEAFQMTKERRESNVDWPEWLHEAWNKGPGEGGMWPSWNEKEKKRRGPEACDLVISTLEGLHRVSFGDWIIQGVAGELYPCKPDIFEMTYDAVEDGS